MSDTVGNTRNRIRWLLNDRNLNQPVIGTFRLDRLISYKSQELGVEIGLGFDRTGSIPLADGEFEKDVGAAIGSSWVPGAQIVELLLNFDRRPLFKTNDDGIDAYFIGTAPRVRSYPRMFSNYTDKNGHLQIRVAPASLGNQVLTVVWRPIPDDLPPGVDTTIIGFENPELRCLEKLVAISVIEQLPDEDLKTLGIGRGVADGWREDLYGTKDGRVGAVRVCAGRRALQLRTGVVQASVE